MPPSTKLWRQGREVYDRQQTSNYLEREPLSAFNFNWILNFFSGEFIIRLNFVFRTLLRFFLTQTKYRKGGIYLNFMAPYLSMFCLPPFYMKTMVSWFKNTYITYIIYKYLPLNIYVFIPAQSKKIIAFFFILIVNAQRFIVNGYSLT